MKNLSLILISVFLGSIGQVLIKIGADKINKAGSFFSSVQSIFTDIFNLVKVPELVFGVIFFGASFLLWVKVLTKSELSYAYPMVSLGYIIVALFSFFLFKETITFNKIAGILLIISGAIFINR